MKSQKFTAFQFLQNSKILWGFCKNEDYSKYKEKVIFEDVICGISDVKLEAVQDYCVSTHLHINENVSITNEDIEIIPISFH